MDSRTYDCKNRKQIYVSVCVPIRLCHQLSCGNLGPLQISTGNFWICFFFHFFFLSANWNYSPFLRKQEVAKLK